MRPWSQRYPDGCRDCGTTERKVEGQGYCSACYSRRKRRGTLVVRRKIAKTRVRDGKRQFFCFDCERWRAIDQFRTGKDQRQFRTRCLECQRAWSRAYHARTKERRNAEQRWKAMQYRELVRQADIRRKQTGDPWHKSAGKIPIETVQTWLVEAYALHAGDALDKPNGWSRVALVAGVSERLIRRLRNREVELVTVDTAESLAQAAGRMDEFRELTVPGIEGWSPYSRFCLRCGRYDVPPHARGYCKRCYQAVEYHKRQGHETAPPPRSERWATWHDSCIVCGTRSIRHQAHGKCSKCYDSEWRQRVREREGRGSRETPAGSGSGEHRHRGRRGA